MADTALTIITDALLDLGVLADGAVPTASQAAGALRKLNNMIDDWNIQNLLVYGSQSYVIPLQAGKAVYTIGPGGDLDIQRPDFIDSAYYRQVGQGAQTLDLPLNVFTDQEWAQQPLKQQTAQVPIWGVWFNYQSPLINAYVLPIPNSSLYSMVIWVRGLIKDLALDDVITLPSGYQRALTANLAIELSSSYGESAQPSAALVNIAQSSKSNIKAQNLQINLLATPGCAQYYGPSNTVFIR